MVSGGLVFGENGGVQEKETKLLVVGLFAFVSLFRNPKGNFGMLILISLVLNSVYREMSLAWYAKTTIPSLVS